MNDIAPRAKYAVVAKRWTHGWELHVDGVGVTQARRLAEAEEMVRDYIVLDSGVPAYSFDVEFSY